MTQPVPFNRPAITGDERANVEGAFERGKFAGIGTFGRRCNTWLTERFDVPRALVTTSGTDALEMAALLCELQPGDEVILPSYAFPSTATAFVRCGAIPVFVDVKPHTMNIDPDAVAAAVNERTRVIVVLHYGGVACDMKAIAAIADAHDLLVVEDAAHAIFADFEDRPCGALGHFGCFSFHETKNVHCGEGGALLVNDERFAARAEIIMEKGTDRASFQRGEIARYEWQDTGSSFVLSELNAAFLLAQLEAGEEITRDRVRTWEDYRQQLAPLVDAGRIELPVVPDLRRHNGHTLWIKTAGVEERTKLTAFLADRGIQAVFHYVPLHSAPAGLRFGRFSGPDRHTTVEAGRLLRLPLFWGFTEVDRVTSAIADYYAA